MIDWHEPLFEAHAGTRKLSLLTIAQSRRVWPTIFQRDWDDYCWNYSRGSCRKSIDECEKAIDLCERFLEGEATTAERDAALVALQAIDRQNHGPFLSLILAAATDWAISAFEGSPYGCYAITDERLPEHEYHLARLIRDISGNPFRPVSLDPSWYTSTVTALARQMYDTRDFSAMPILADALQDAGCEDEGVLNHCRDEKHPHCRGCWVIDTLLGRE